MRTTRLLRALASHKIDPEVCREALRYFPDAIARIDPLGYGAAARVLPDGITIEALPLDLFIGPARVCAVECGTHITAADVAKAGVQGETRVLFKTRNSMLLKKGVYDATFAPISVDGAKALVDSGVKLVGLDYLSAAGANEQVPVHRAFLDHGVILLEGVDLSEVPPGRYELFCPPVKLAGSDGAPCRAVLRELAT
jgi:arylformamidase